MGTNYYLETSETCEHCGQVTNSARIHIGKSSAGWYFMLHIHDKEGFRSLGEWMCVLARNSDNIVDENGRETSLAEMLGVMYCRGWPPRAFDEQFLAENQAIVGINGLLRPRFAYHIPSIPIAYCERDFS